MHRRQDTATHPHDRAWSLELAKPESPFRTLQQKPIIIFHCKQSTNRTPMFASSYIVAIAQRTGQKVVILEGGFEGYKLKEQKGKSNRHL